MIISDRFGLAFVHIPKCAGTTVREQLERADPKLFQLAGRQRHPELGRIDAMHLPLETLRDHFPDVLARLRAATSFALTRDPRDRFRSSVSEYVKTYEGRRLSEFAPGELGRVIDGIAAALAPRTALLPLRYVHFTPQEHYVRLDGETVVTHRYAIEDIAALFAELGRRTGAAFDAGSRANQDFAFRFRGSEMVLWRLNTTLKAFLPYAAYQGLKRRAKPLLARTKPDAVAAVFASAEVRDLVRDVYAADFALHAEDRRASTA